MSLTKSHPRSASPLGRSDRTAEDTGFHHACSAKMAAEHPGWPAGPAQPGSSDSLHERLGRRSQHDPGRHADGDLGPRTSDQKLPDTILPSATLAPLIADEDSLLHLPESTVFAWNSVVAQLLRWRRSPTPDSIPFKREHSFVRCFGCPLITTAFNRQAEG